MHRMLGVLRAPDTGEPTPAPGLARIGELLDPARAVGMRAVLSVTGEVRPLPAGVELAAYRIVQEAVTNVLRHAAAGRVECAVDYGRAAVELRVVDDGEGQGTPGSDGQGHVGMRERAALYGGKVETAPRPGGGYSVHAILPVPEPAAPAGVAEGSS